MGGEHFLHDKILTWNTDSFGTQDYVVGSNIITGNFMVNLTNTNTDSADETLYTMAWDITGVPAETDPIQIGPSHEIISIVCRSPNDPIVHTLLGIMYNQETGGYYSTDYSYTVALSDQMGFGLIASIVNDENGTRTITFSKQKGDQSDVHDLVLEMRDLRDQLKDSTNNGLDVQLQFSAINRKIDAIWPYISKEQQKALDQFRILIGLTIHDMVPNKSQELNFVYSVLETGNNAQTYEQYIPNTTVDEPSNDTSQDFVYNFTLNSQAGSSVGMIKVQGNDTTYNNSTGVISNYCTTLYFEDGTMTFAYILYLESIPDFLPEVPIQLSFLSGTGKYHKANVSTAVLTPSGSDRQIQIKYNPLPPKITGLKQELALVYSADETGDNAQTYEQYIPNTTVEEPSNDTSQDFVYNFTLNSRAGSVGMIKVEGNDTTYNNQSGIISNYCTTLYFEDGTMTFAYMLYLETIPDFLPEVPIQLSFLSGTGKYHKADVSAAVLIPSGTKRHIKIKYNLVPPKSTGLKQPLNFVYSVLETGNNAQTYEQYIPNTTVDEPPNDTSQDFVYNFTLNSQAGSSVGMIKVQGNDTTDNNSTGSISNYQTTLYFEDGTMTFAYILYLEYIPDFLPEVPIQLSFLSGTGKYYNANVSTAVLTPSGSDRQIQMIIE